MDGQDTTHDAPAHDAGTAKGEEKSSVEGKEAGRHEMDDSHADRPAGGSTMRDSTSINPEDREPKDPYSPKMPPA